MARQPALHAPEESFASIFSDPISLVSELSDAAIEISFTEAAGTGLLVSRLDDTLPALQQWVSGALWRMRNGDIVAISDDNPVQPNSDGSGDSVFVCQGTRPGQHLVVIPRLDAHANIAAFLPEATVLAC